MSTTPIPTDKIDSLESLRIAKQKLKAKIALQEYQLQQQMSSLPNDLMKQGLKKAGGLVSLVGVAKMARSVANSGTLGSVVTQTLAGGLGKKGVVLAGVKIAGMLWRRFRKK